LFGLRCGGEKVEEHAMSESTSEKVMRYRKEYPPPNGAQWYYDSAGKKICNKCNGRMNSNVAYLEIEITRDKYLYQCEFCVPGVSQSVSVPPPDLPQSPVPEKKAKSEKYPRWIMQTGRCYFCGISNCYHAKRLG
jgi:hypothetical protein